MAFLFDHNDPSGLGMFSKIGRLSSQKILIFKKTELLQDKKRPSTAIQKKKQNTNEVKENLITETQDETKTPFFKQTSRMYIDQIKAVKNPGPAVGYYRPKVDIVSKNHEQVYNLHHQKKTYSRVQSAQTQRQEDIYKEQPGKQRKKVQGYVDTQNFTERKDYKNINDAHPDRFLQIHQSLFYSKNKKVTGFQMQKVSQRKTKYSQVMNNPYYKNNFEIKKKRLNILVPQFEKTLERSFRDKESMTQNEQFYQYDKYTKSVKKDSQVWSKNKTVDFSKYLNRDSDKQEQQLPSYSQKNVNSRQQIINYGTSKSLELNKYKNGRFQTIHTGFPQEKQSQKLKNNFINEI